jgi:hypothetical protein
MLTASADLAATAARGQSTGAQCGVTASIVAAATVPGSGDDSAEVALIITGVLTATAETISITTTLEASTIVAGDDIVLDIEVLDPQGAPKDVTGATGTFLIYDGPGRGQLVFEGTVTLVDAEAGLIRATLADEVTDGAGYRVLWYAVKLTEATGRETTIKYGRLLVNA